MDYQNVHLVGWEAFPSSRNHPAHLCLIDPLHFANQLIRRRNAAQGPGYPHAVLSDLWVYRGQPSNKHDPADYARSLAQKAQWERDPRVHVTLRPLRYSVQRDGSGKAVHDARGREIVIGKREKGVDVLCALAVVREAAKDDVDLVILASHDSDLEPALDEVRTRGTAKIETFRWASPDVHVYQLRPSTGSAWNTKLDEQAFLNARDTTRY
jgi:hypothetical protein